MLCVLVYILWQRAFQLSGLLNKAYQPLIGCGIPMSVTYLRDYLGNILTCVDLPRPLKPKFLALANELVMDCKMWADHYAVDVNTWCFKITPPNLTLYPHLAIYAEFSGGIKSSAQYIWSSPATGNWHSNPDLAYNPNDISDESSDCWYDGTNTGKPGSWSKPVTDLSFVR
ncbi:hypothetical protein QOT17_010334 [Balamuthia mandrillaris]